MAVQPSPIGVEDRIGFVGRSFDGDYRQRKDKDGKDNRSHGNCGPRDLRGFLSDCTGIEIIGQFGSLPDEHPPLGPAPG